MTEDSSQNSLQNRASGMTSSERRTAISLAMIYSMRMLGLFMILPVFSLYMDDIPGATPMLIGLALGVYGLTQGILQIPFGLISDRIGRKPVILVGLLLFVAGSVLAALSESIYGIIAGRALQGTGAIAAVVMALAADLTRESQRTKIMAMIGMSIGASFMLAMVIGPIFNSWFGLSGIFWITAGMALAGIAVLILVVPTPVHSSVHRDAEPVPELFRKVLSDSQLLRLNIGIFCLHIMLTACFLVFPQVLKNDLGLASEQHWQFYLPVLFASLLLMVPFVILAERHRRLKSVFQAAVLVLALTQLSLVIFPTQMEWFVVTLVVFFVAFNLLEATLPSLVSKIAPAECKGTAMGFYSSSQFLGIFAGGLLGGYALQHWGYNGVFLLCAGIAVIWYMFTLGMKNPNFLSSYLLNVGSLDVAQAALLVQKLNDVQGVAEAVVVAEDGVAYLKIDKKMLDEPALHACAANATS
jgi:MFS family permease